MSELEAEVLPRACCGSADDPPASDNRHSDREEAGKWG